MLGISSRDAGVHILHTFDRLTEHHARADELVQTAARLGRCPAGVGDSAGRPVARCNAAGHALPLRRPEGVQMQWFGQDGATGGVAWLEPEGPLGPEQGLVLDRLAFALGRQEASDALAASSRSRRRAALEALLGDGASDLDRAGATRVLSLSTGDRVRVLWVVPRDAEHNGIDRAVWLLRHALGELLRWTRVDGRLLVLVRDAELDRALANIPQPAFTVAVGPVERATSASVSGASVALRFASHEVGPSTVRYDDLGALATLLTVPRSAALDSAEVRTVQRLAEQRDGLIDLRCLEAFLRLGSLRAAARELFLHHSSVASHLDRVFSELELDRDRPLHRWRAQTALALWITGGGDGAVPAAVPSEARAEPDTRRAWRPEPATHGRVSTPLAT